MKVDFYQGGPGSDQGPELLVCLLTEKAFSQSHRVFIRTGDAAQARRLDEMLWTFRQDSFIPHALATTGVDEPVLIGEVRPQAAEPDLLINLGPGLAPDRLRYRRVLEIVHPERLTEARQSFRHYREQGLAPEYHRMDGSA